MAFQYSRERSADRSCNLDNLGDFGELVMKKFSANVGAASLSSLCAMKEANHSLPNSLGEEVTTGMEEVAMLLQLASNRFAAGDYDDAWQYVRVVEGVHPVVENTTVNLLVERFDIELFPDFSAK